MGLSNTERAVCDDIRQRAEFLLRELGEHVAIPTGRGYAPGLREYRALLMERLTRLGADVEVLVGDDRPQWLEVGDSNECRHTESDASSDAVEELVNESALVVRAERTGSGTGPRVLLCGHIDTVHDPQGDFRELTPDDGGAKVRGPGAVDMKGGTLIALTALEALHEHGVELNWTYLLNSDEETGSFHSMRVLRETAAHCDVGLVTEPALPGGALAIERMGSGQFKVEVFGQSAHVGREFEKGVSAVTELAAVITALSKLAEPEKGKIVNVGPLRGGGVTNAVPDYAACWGNARFRDPQAGEELGAAIDALATDGEVLPRVVVHRKWNRPAKPETDAVRELASTVKQVADELGQPMEFVRTGGVCDGNVLQAAGLPVVDTLGVRGGNLHRLDEFVEVASLVERCQMMAVVLNRLGR